MMTNSKHHFEVLDGLRGVAALVVLLFHVLEIFSNGDHSQQIINHGYLAVDFFFMLSGFVIVHAYDGRWQQGMRLGSFAWRRLVRLHPMILMGMTIGAVLFYAGAQAQLFPAIAGTPLWKLLLVLAIGYLLIPVPLSLDIRGWTEMYPLNGPAWSLFYEYVANMLYALVLRRLSNAWLAVLVLAAAAVTGHYLLTTKAGDIIGGWALTPEQVRLGLTRLAFPFLAGMLLRRLYRPGQIAQGFWWCSLLLIAVLAVPRVGQLAWQNGLYELLCIVLAFPLIVWMGASTAVQQPWLQSLNRWLGQLSYPLYIIHYPIIYVYYRWVLDHKKTLTEALPAGLGVALLCVLLAMACYRWYDAPVRQWLTNRNRCSA